MPGNDLRFTTLACFQKNAGVNIAKRMAPMVAWSSARMEAVCERGYMSSLQRKRKTETHVVARPDPANPGCRPIAMCGPDILESASGCQTYREASTETRP